MVSVFAQPGAREAVDEDQVRRSGMTLAQLVALVNQVGQGCSCEAMFAPAETDSADPDPSAATFRETIHKTLSTGGWHS